MTLADNFRRSYQNIDSVELSDPELLPTRLAMACTAVLPVAGAGLSAFTDDGFRIPLGSSDDASTAAERLQFTLGQGPCIDAHAATRTVLATETLLAARWPMFHEQLVVKTPYRAIVAVPLRDGLAGFGTLDLFLHSSQELADLVIGDVDEITALATTMLLSDGSITNAEAADETGPRWSQGPAATRRNWVFIAIGLLNVALEVSQEDALAVLRAHAYSTNRTLDDVAYDVANRQIPASELRTDSAS